MKKVIPLDASLIPDKAKCVFKGEIFDVYQWDQELYDGSTAVFEMLKRPDTIQVLAIVDDKLIILEDEQPNRLAMLTPPGGRVDLEDESPLAAAKRELKEETGYELSDWRLVQVVKPASKIEWFIYIFVAWGKATLSQQTLDAGEKIDVRQVALEEFKALLQKDHPYLKEQKVITEDTISLDELKATPEFVGKEVDR